MPQPPGGLYESLVTRALAERLAALPANLRARQAHLRPAELAATTASGDVTLKQFLDATGLDLDDVYAGTYSWSDLRERANLATGPAGEHEATLRRACGRLLHVDDLGRLTTWRGWLQSDAPPEMGTSHRSDRLLRMLLAQLLDQVTGVGEWSPGEGAAVLWGHPQVRRELGELFEVLEERVSHLTSDLGGLPDVPLRVHARYTRIEILAACGVGEGVGHPGRQRDRVTVPGTRPPRQPRPALRAPEHHGEGLPLPRAGGVCPARVRAAHGDHVEAGASVARRSVSGLCGGGGVRSLWVAIGSRGRPEG
jgi:hypothetical protein